LISVKLLHTFVIIISVYKKIFSIIQFPKLIYPNKLEQIKYLEANKNNTILHVHNARSITSGYNLKQFEKILEGNEQFLRVHRSYIVNANFVKKVNDDSLFLRMDTDEVIPVIFPEVLAQKVEVTNN
jgi:DNA-binding LytR/AlgR family response regulator